MNVILSHTGALVHSLSLSQRAHTCAWISRPTTDTHLVERAVSFLFLWPAGAEEAHRKNMAEGLRQCMHGAVATRMATYMIAGTEEIRFKSLTVLPRLPVNGGGFDEDMWWGR